MVKLKLVTHNNKPVPTGRWQGHDTVFIHRGQLHIGTKLTYFGRLSHGAEWYVTGMFSVHDSGRRRHKTEVTHWRDSVTLQRVGSNETRVMGFMHLSYSAIWRIAE